MAIENLTARVGADIGPFRQAMSQMGPIARQQGQIGSEAMAGFRSSILSTIAALGITGGLVGALRGALSVTSEFQNNMNAVRAVTGATGESFNELQGLALQLGRDTAFSAREAAQGMRFLGMAGFNTRQVLAALPSTLDLAAAGQLDLASAADIASNVLTAFRLEADETTMVVDVLASTATSSNTSVSQMAEAMKFVSTTAAQIRTPLTQTAAAIGLLGNAGIQGSLAGTALNQAFVALLRNTPTAQAAMEKLGLTFKDSEGNLKPLIGIIQELEEGLEAAGLNATEAATAVVDIFGVRGGRAINALLAQGGAALERFNNRLLQSEGSAKRMADIMLEGLPGALKITQSSIEGLGIAVGEGLAAPLEDLLRDTLIPTINATAEWARVNQTMIGILAEMGGGLTALVVGGGSLFLFRSLIARVVTSLGAMAALLGPGGAVLVGVLALAAAFASIAGSLEDLTSPSRGISKLIDEFENLGNKTQRTADEEQRLSELEEKLTALFPGLTGLITDRSVAVQRVADALRDANDEAERARKEELLFRSQATTTGGLGAGTGAAPGSTLGELRRQREAIAQRLGLGSNIGLAEEIRRVEASQRAQAGILGSPALLQSEIERISASQRAQGEIFLEPSFAGLPPPRAQTPMEQQEEMLKRIKKAQEEAEKTSIANFNAATARAEQEAQLFLLNKQEEERFAKEQLDRAIEQARLEGDIAVKAFDERTDLVETEFEIEREFQDGIVDLTNRSLRQRLNLIEDMHFEVDRLRDQGVLSDEEAEEARARLLEERRRITQRLMRDEVRGLSTFRGVWVAAFGEARTQTELLGDAVSRVGGSLERGLSDALFNTVTGRFESLKDVGLSVADALARAFTDLAAQSIVSGITSLITLAEGGLVNRPTLALLGEEGPELVIPLRAFNVTMRKVIRETITGLFADTSLTSGQAALAAGQLPTEGGAVFGFGTGPGPGTDSTGSAGATASAGAGFAGSFLGRILGSFAANQTGLTGSGIGGQIGGTALGAAGAVVGALFAGPFGAFAGGFIGSAAGTLHGGLVEIAFREDPARAISLLMAGVDPALLGLGHFLGLDLPRSAIPGPLGSFLDPIGLTGLLSNFFGFGGNPLEQISHRRRETFEGLEVKLANYLRALGLTGSFLDQVHQNIRNFVIWNGHRPAPGNLDEILADLAGIDLSAYGDLDLIRGGQDVGGAAALAILQQALRSSGGNRDFVNTVASFLDFGPTSDEDLSRLIQMSQAVGLRPFSPVFAPGTPETLAGALGPALASGGVSIQGAARGFRGVINSPTLFMTGEEGPESINIQPFASRELAFRDLFSTSLRDSVFPIGFRSEIGRGGGIVIESMIIQSPALETHEGRRRAARLLIREIEAELSGLGERRATIGRI